MEKKKVKQSLIAGALTGSAGILITKILSLLYVIPFNSIAGDNTVFYSYAYTVYDSLLQICLSGIPYAIATLVAKYSTKNDYSTVRVVKKVSKAVVLTLGFTGCLVMLVFTRALALRIIPTELQATDYILKTEMVLRIVAFALVFVPLLSYYRGFYQGLKEMKTYAFTQVFEQVVRIGFLLGASCLFVYAFRMDRIWAAYMGVASTSVSAIAAIIYFISYDKKYALEGDPNEKSSYTKLQILKELIKNAIPYLLSSIMLSCSGMFVLLMFARGLERYGTDAKMITIYQGIINYQGAKLQSIPMIFMTGFCLSIIPHVTEAYYREDDLAVQSIVSKVLLTVNYLSVPVICLMVFFSKEIFYVMYGNYYLNDGASLLSKLLICQLFANFYGIFQSLLIAMQQRKLYIRIEAIRLVIMLVIFTPCLSTFGINGYFIALLIEYFVFLGLSVLAINSKYKFDFADLFTKATKSWVGCIPMFIIGAFVNQFHYNVLDNSRFMILIVTGCLCAISALGYVIITYRNGVITELFGIKLDKETLNKVLSRFKKS